MIQQWQIAVLVIDCGIGLDEVNKNSKVSWCMLLLARIFELGQTHELTLRVFRVVDM
jgi:hypothetical protein